MFPRILALVSKLRYHCSQVTRKKFWVSDGGKCELYSATYTIKHRHFGIHQDWLRIAVARTKFIYSLLTVRLFCCYYYYFYYKYCNKNNFLFRDRTGNAFNHRLSINAATTVQCFKLSDVLFASNEWQLICFQMLSQIRKIWEFILVFYRKFEKLEKS